MKDFIDFCKSRKMLLSQTNIPRIKKRLSSSGIFFEATTRFELVCKALQASASPLGHVANILLL
jgi:hypothetical protein